LAAGTTASPLVIGVYHKLINILKKKKKKEPLGQKKLQFIRTFSDGKLVA
jgi:hypothetical protein